jgi:hypothetical protein
MIYQEGHGHKQVSIKDHACEIIKAYRDDLQPMITIAERYNCTRQAVFKLLKRKGIDTNKAQRTEQPCHTCGKPVLRRRGKARVTRYFFCDRICYEHYLNVLGEDYKPSAYHCRIGRQVVKDRFKEYNPEAGHIVHHVNKDNTDSRPINLWVFANQSDHLLFHRGYDKTPIWMGGKY